METQESIVGKGRYGKEARSTYQRRNIWNIKDGENHYRVLPPLFGLREPGLVAKFWRIHWGYTIPNENGGKPQYVWFSCIERKNKDKMIVQECPECTQIEKRDKQYNAALEARTLEIMTANPGLHEEMAKKQARDFVKPMREWLDKHNRQGQWHLNVVNSQGEIGRLAIPHGMFEQFDNKCEKIFRESNETVDPCGVDAGVMFDFNRIKGSNGKYTHQVETVMETVNVPGMGFMSKMKMVPMTQTDQDKLAKEAWDLSDLYPILSETQIKRLVDSEGDPEVVKAIFQAARPVKKEQSPAPVAQPRAAAPPPASVPAPVATAPAMQQIQPGPDVAAMMAQLAALQAQILKSQQPTPPVVTQAPVAAAPAPVQAPTGASNEVENMSDEEFFKRFGQGDLSK